MAVRYEPPGPPRYVQAAYGGYRHWAYRSPVYTLGSYIGPGVGPGYGYRPGFVYGLAGPGPVDAGFYWGDIQAARYRGVGPRGYQRPDERIREDINDRMTEDPYLDARDIEVHVENGVVTLTGSVPERYQRRRVQDIVETVPGVRGIHNRLTVGQLVRRAGRERRG